MKLQMNWAGIKSQKSWTGHQRHPTEESRGYKKHNTQAQRTTRSEVKGVHLGASGRPQDLSQEKAQIQSRNWQETCLGYQVWLQVRPKRPRKCKSACKKENQSPRNS